MSEDGSRPVRKKLRLGGFDYGNVGHYFLTVCTKDKAQTLGCVVGADVLIGPPMRLSALGRIVEEHILHMPTVERYVIMPNHIHLLVRLHNTEGGPMGTSAPTQSIPKLIHYLKASVCKVWGSPVWQRSYYDHILRNEADYLRVWDYMDQNPAKWAEDDYYVESAP